jgi:VWFA-related protein
MRSKSFAVGLCLLAFIATTFAQQQVAFDVLKAYPGTTEKAPFVLRSQVVEVAVQLAVTDLSGKPVMGLAPDDLQILDNGIPAAITELRREDELPLRVAVVIDWSDSMQKELGFERKVALDFLRTVLRPDVDQAMEVGFRYRVEVTQPLTGDIRSLEAGLRPVGGVSLSSVYDALLAATDGLRNADPYLPQRRAIVLLSDGEDNVSAHGLLDAIKAAQRANVTIYTIAPQRRIAPRHRRSKSAENPRSFAVAEPLAEIIRGQLFLHCTDTITTATTNSAACSPGAITTNRKWLPQEESSARAGDDVLRGLAAVTGGRAFFIPPSGEQTAFETIQQHLRLGYAVYFKPGAVGGDHLRSLEITAKDRNLQVWAPHSYYVGWE